MSLVLHWNRFWKATTYKQSFSRQNNFTTMLNICLKYSAGTNLVLVAIKVLYSLWRFKKIFKKKLKWCFLCPASTILSSLKSSVELAWILLEACTSCPIALHVAQRMPRRWCILSMEAYDLGKGLPCQPTHFQAPFRHLTLWGS